MFKKSIFTIITYSILFPTLVRADHDTDHECYQLWGCSIARIAEPIAGLIAALTTIVVALGVLFVIIAGIKYITSSGDPEKAESAKNTATWAIIALIAAVMLWPLLRFILFDFLGVPLPAGKSWLDGVIEFYIEKPPTSP